MQDTIYNSKYHILLCLMPTHAFVCIIDGIIISMIRNHYTRVQCASLLFLQKFGQNSAQYTQQNISLLSSLAKIKCSIHSKIW